jgi:hypothetical protein
LKEPVHTARRIRSTRGKSGGDNTRQIIVEIGESCPFFNMTKCYGRKTAESMGRILPSSRRAFGRRKRVDKRQCRGRGIGGAIGVALSDDPKIAQINELLDERIRPFLASDCGWLEILSLDDKTLKIVIKGRAEAVPSSLTGT